MPRPRARFLALPIGLVLASLLLGCDFPSGLASTNLVPSFRFAPSFASSLQLSRDPVKVSATVNADSAQQEPLAAGEALPASSFAADEPPQRPALNTVVSPPNPIAASGSFAMPMPFHTQKDGSRYEGANCGPATLGMVLDAFGIVQSNPDLRYLTAVYQDTVDQGGGTALQSMAAVGADFGLQPVGLYDDADFHSWTIEDIRGQLAQGNPVIPLVKYRLLPDHTASTYRWDHYIVIYGMQGNRFLYHDPAYATPRDGAAHWITAEQLDAAMQTTLVPHQAVAFAPGELAALRIKPL